jgi:hypothetical protein
MKYISTVEAAKAIGCSVHHVHNCVRVGELKGKWVVVGTRKLLKISEASLKKYLPIALQDKRIGRELFCRSPKKRVDRKQRGYIRVHRPDHPRADCDGYVNQHYLVMEEHLGRHLTKDEVVHHINRIRDDNRIENLTIYGSQADHMSAEHSEFLALMFKLKGSDQEQAAIQLLKTLVK